MKTKFTILILVTVLFTSCGPKLSGKDEESFKASKAKMEETLDEADKEKLEIALRVVVMKAMKEKWDKPDDVRFKGKSFDAISMVMVDGKTFSGLVSYAENFLKEDRDKNIAEHTKEIDSLKKDNEKISLQNKELDGFKLTKISLVEGEFMSEKVPYVDYTLINKTGQEILRYTIQMDVFDAKTGQLVASGSRGTGEEIDADDNIEGIKPDEEYSTTEVLNGIDSTSEFLKNAKYPITNLSSYNLKIKVFLAMMITKKGKYIRTKTNNNLEQQIAVLETTIKELKEKKGTLDELQLTD
ncbi:hypothetical protein [Flavobacterium tegetincola]|uniref:hypothetical protein n=1 Tax=Flavobacterium tegetincola TaxID=150172 RepID=UPI000479DF36|nr:hypothetical protein [Flavobacterium tegetincola]